MLTIRFYARLNLFLPAHQRQCSIAYAFRGQPSVKNVIESLGVPHTEVDLILVDNEPVNFTYPVHGGERAAVYPAFQTLDRPAAVRLRPDPPAACRFILDNHLGKLAALLRMLGFDARYEYQMPDAVLAAESVAQDRILLTRDRELLHRKQIVQACHMWSLDPTSQLVEVLQRYSLFGRLRLFERCLLCNEPLADIAKEAVLPRVPAPVYASFNEFKTCPACGRIYWKGIHYDSMRAFVERITAANQPLLTTELSG